MVAAPKDSIGIALNRGCCQVFPDFSVGHIAECLSGDSEASVWRAVGGIRGRG